MNTATQTFELKRGQNGSGLEPGYFARRNVWDWLFAVLVVAGAVWSFMRYSPAMDGYEKAILAGAVPAVIWLGWFWRPLRVLMVVVAALSLLAISLYQTPEGTASLARAEQVFMLKYFISSQSAILWMSVLFFMSTIFYWVGMFTRAGNAFESLGSRLAWVAVTLALVGTMVRWYESHQIGVGIGHIPVSNLYEVFVLFCWMTAAFYLYYEEQYNTRSMGAFVMLVVSAAVGFLLWYTVVREAHEIQPLVPALQSWWMKLHVPANFIGYGTFAISAMLAFAYLIKQSASESRWYKLAPLWLLGIVLCFEPIVFRTSAAEKGGSYWFVYFGISALIVATILFGRRRIAERLPSFEVLDDVMYKAIAVGFAFFTIATVLGAFWAAEAWGGYWSWDPKETWALIVWLNYAAWLHMRLMKGL
ncbi:MAG: c-type cytochrome biogenesis protein CcsB, partial [Gammaproteobacteria bacterium]|nr:c-type cytochrome biogenesis protein CcsB [Gammaproteobacteria bacterium]